MATMRDGQNLTVEVNDSPESVCATIITMNGMWAGGNPLKYPLPLFIIQVILVMLATHLFALILKPIRQPRVISEILGGILLGPSALGKIEVFSKAVFPEESKVLIETVGNVGILYFTFLVGVGMDVPSLRRIGRKAVAIGVVGMILPFAVGASFAYVLMYKSNVPNTEIGSSVIFLGVIVSVSAFPVLARILAELKLTNTEIGRIALSSALVTDIVSWALLIVSIALILNQKPSITIFYVLGSALAFILLNIFAVRPLMLWITSRTPEGKEFSDFCICMILSGVMMSGFITETIGVHFLVGAFVFGLTIPNGPLGLTIAERIEDFMSVLLVPLFFALTGLKTDLGQLKGFHIWAILLTLVALCCIGKVLGTIGIAVYYQMSVREGAVLGLLMNTKGIIEVLILNIGVDKKVLTQETFSALVFITVMMIAVIVPGISVIYKPSREVIPYNTRTIHTSNRDSEFRVLVCVHTPRNVPTMINLLEASNPTKQSPICIYVLHLTELTGNASALLIAHNLQTKKTDQATYNRAQAQSDRIINAFENYEQHASNVSVQTLTAVSPYSTMHEDIINIAQDKRVAFIIVPFHKQKTVDGGLEALDTSFRTVNLNVLDKAPCSVGILVDRGLTSFNYLASVQNSHRVAVLFFGGPDDREALSYGWRMSEHPGVNLTVMRFVHGEEVVRQYNGGNVLHPDEQRVLTVETDKDSSQKKLDEQLMHWFRTNHGDDDSVLYIEKMVNSGEQTVAAIRGMNDVHDLFIVGRGQAMTSPCTTGLTSWSECPELGAIGDLLASSDFTTTASVLVVQQYVGEGTEGVGLGTLGGGVDNNAVMTNEEYVNQNGHNLTSPRGHNLFNQERL